MTPLPFRAVIWDMDGVLVDTEPRHFAALARVVAESGRQVPEDLARDLLGLTIESTWDLVIDRLHLAGSRAEYLDRYHHAVLDELARPLDPLPGVLDCLTAIDRAGLPLALASSSPRPWIRATLAGLGLTDRFPIAVSGDDVAAGKPAPDIFHRAAALLGVDPAGCLVIEDSPAGIEAGRRAGMRVLAVRTALTEGVPLPAEWVIESLADLDLAAWFPPAPPAR